MLCVTTVILAVGCGRKGDPIPRPRAAPGACDSNWLDGWRLSVRLPANTVAGPDGKTEPLRGLSKVRVFYLPLSSSRPTALDLAQRGEVILERGEPNLPSPGQQVVLEFTGQERGPGWIVVVAYRVGDVSGRPGEVLPWLHPALRGSIHHP